MLKQDIPVTLKEMKKITFKFSWKATNSILSLLMMDKQGETIHQVSKEKPLEDQSIIYLKDKEIGKESYMIELN